MREGKRTRFFEPFVVKQSMFVRVELRCLPPAHRNAMSTFMVRLTLTIGGLT